MVKKVIHLFLILAMLICVAGWVARVTETMQSHDAKSIEILGTLLALGVTAVAMYLRGRRDNK